MSRCSGKQRPGVTIGSAVGLSFCFSKRPRASGIFKLSLGFFSCEVGLVSGLDLRWWAGSVWHCWGKLPAECEEPGAEGWKMSGCKQAPTLAVLGLTLGCLSSGNPMEHEASGQVVGP